MTKADAVVSIGRKRIRSDDEAFIAELRHRARSTLATMRAILRRSAETSSDLEDYIAHLDGRLAALARVQQAAIHDPLAGLDLSLLVYDELASAALCDIGRATIEGPTVLLHPRAAESFALALHELTINALKFGALSKPAGLIAVSWRIEPTSGPVPRLHFDWIEDGGASIQHGERRKGFGVFVLKEMIGYNLEAQTELDFLAGGFRCCIKFPLSGRTLVANTQN